MAEVNYENWAKTVSVENVQALAAATNGSGQDIPQRYIRSELETNMVVNASNEKVPVINMSRLLDPRFSQDECAKLDAACLDWGFFQLVGHGIPHEVIKKMEADLEEFFKLPLQEKKAFAPSPGGIQGYGHNFAVPDEQKLDWHDFLFLITHPLHSRNMKFWPTAPPSFSSTLDRYSLELNRVAKYLLESMAKNLVIDPDLFSRIFKDQSQGMRMNYYPPCAKANKVIGRSAHHDVSGLTLLLQVGDVQGLQIKRNGKWLPVEPLQHSLLVNIGDAIQILSNGIYQSVEHRVVVNNRKERLSIAAFHSPNLDSIVGPLPELVKGGKKHYMTMNYRDIKKLLFLERVEGKSHLHSIRLDS